MALSPGTRVGPYEVLDPLAAGGMGQIYRARDTRLGRDVAIKVITDALHARPDLRERFKVEATAIAALNHPNICQVYDVGEFDGHDYLVMELVEGESLAARLKRGRIPLTQAMTIIREIAGALEAAHRRGIVHRDVKPSNVMLTRAGVKLLDFGLARLRPLDPSIVAGASTIASDGGPLTSTGMALGTWQYMAPEQVRGEPADSRSDVFALGALIYEVVTGRRAFDGATHAELVASILETDPPSMLVVDPAIPQALDHVVRSCLAKDPNDRWHSAGEVRRALDTVDTSGSPRTRTEKPPSARPWMTASIVTAVAIGVSAVVILALWRPGSAAVAPGIVRTSAVPGDVTIPPDGVVFTADGKSFVFSGSRLGVDQLYRYDLPTGITSPIEGTDHGFMPFFSPDGQWLGFSGLTQLMKVPAAGGRPVPIAPGSIAFGASWGDDGFIVYSEKPESGLLRISATGGTAEPLTTIAEEDRGNDHRYPQVLPGSRGVLFAVGTGPEDTARIVVLDRRNGAIKTLLQGSMSCTYVPTGHLAYTRDGVLYVIPFDANRLEVTGPPVQIASGVDDWNGEPRFSFSPSGDLVFAAAKVRGPQLRLALIDLRGQVEYVPLQGNGQYPRFSPDGGRIAFQRSAAKNNVWVYDFKRTTATRVTYGRYHQPVWTPDGRLTLATGGPGNTRLVIRTADGSGSDEILTGSGADDLPRSWTPDGHTLIFERYGENQSDLLTLTLPSLAVKPLLAAPYNERNGRVSPDGTWLAYASTEDGTTGQIYIRPLAGEGRRVQVSAHTANFCVWSPDGRRLYFRGPGPEGQGAGIWVAEITTQPVLSASKPRWLFDNAGFYGSFDLSPDGTHFVMTQQDQRPPQRQFELVQNWFRQPAATR